MSFKSFLHIYLRHVKELTVENQFGERSKFQLAEKDLTYYYNGDYYDIDILPDGQIGSFYKRIDN